MYFHTLNHVQESIHTSSQLTDLVVTFLKMWREYANEVNGVTIPRRGFTVSVRPMRSPHTISVIVVETPWDFFPDPTYYEDVRGVGYTKEWSIADVPHISTHDVLSHLMGSDECIPWSKGKYTQVNIPLSLLCSPKSRQFIETIANAVRETEALKARQDAITRLQKRIDDIKAGGPIEEDTDNTPFENVVEDHGYQSGDDTGSRYPYDNY